MEKMLITQGLNELKTLDSRIVRAIDKASFVASAKTSEKKVTPNVTKEEYIVSAKASLDSINNLIARREAIKSAIVESNANTMVEICGQKYSVAKVIDMKYSITYKKMLLDKFKEEFGSASLKMRKKNIDMEDRINDLINTVYGKENKTKPEDVNSIVVPYREREEYSLVDPINIEKAIKELEDYIEEFESTVDSTLQISNCVTTIEF